MREMIGSEGWRTLQERAAAEDSQLPRKLVEGSVEPVFRDSVVAAHSRWE